MSSNYFDRVSSTYSKSCKTGIHGSFKSKEAKGLRSALLRHYPDSYKGNLIDIGCATGFYTEELRTVYKNLHFTGVDPSSGMIEAYRKLGLRGVHSNVESLAGESVESFDIFLACGVLEFVKDVDRFVQSIKAMSARESTLFAIVPKMGLISLGYFLHHKLMNEIYIRSLKSYIHAFQTHGFKDVESVNLTAISELLIFKIEKK